MRYAFICVFLLLFNACSVRETPAPVVEAGWNKEVSSKRYSVKSGDTLYSVAWRYGYDYKVLARFNHLSSPYPLHVHQIIRLPDNKETQKIASRVEPKISSTKLTVLVKPKKKQSLKSKTTANTASKKGTKAWIFPANGKIVSRYSKKGSAKGIDVSGHVGSAIRASSDGIVAYSGNGLSGYGNLIIIKHDSTFLSAYAFNRKNLVKEGEIVKAGAKIAEMGVNNKGKTLLHFEIRRNGKPVDPLRFVKAK